MTRPPPRSTLFPSPTLSRSRGRGAGVPPALTPLGLWARARRWRYLFPPRSDPPGLLPAVMIGYMANNLLPLRAGEVVRVYVVARRWSAAGADGTGRVFWTALATLIVERVLDSFAVVLMLGALRSEEHTSELQSQSNLVCRLLLEKKIEH